MNIDRPFAPVSVIIPCYICASTIWRAVDSIFEQSLLPSEVILVEDCSGDGTLEVLRKIERQYAGWIKVITLGENSGAASARNAGWAIATQPYIAFLDADDSWHPDKLRIQHEYMLNNPDVVLCGHQCIYLLENKIPPVLSKNLHETKITAISLLFKNAFSTPTVILKSNIPFRFQEGKRCAEDILLWQKIAFSGLQIVRIEVPLAYVHKPLYGVSGLSKQLWKMEKGELSNFVALYRAANINFMLYSSATFFSIIKFFKRVLATKLKSLMKILLCRGDVA